MSAAQQTVKAGRLRLVRFAGQRVRTYTGRGKTFAIRAGVTLTKKER